jgi:hypothetical protein
MSAAETLDAEKVLRVKLLCQLTMGSAETVAANDIYDDMYEYEKERYHKNKLKALQMTNSIVDRFYFEAALHEIIGLCLAANEVNDAIKLFNTITVDTIRDSILKSHPRLDQSVW